VRDRLSGAAVLAAGLILVAIGAVAYVPIVVRDYPMLEVAAIVIGFGVILSILGLVLLFSRGSSASLPPSGSLEDREIRSHSPVVAPIGVSGGGPYSALAGNEGPIGRSEDEARRREQD